VSSYKVFVVHGHDGAPKAEVARFIEKLGFEAIILHERPNKGRALITKFREESDGAGFAVVLMTPDDVGKAKDAPDVKSRARQNVVFELGFFIGKIGPERVAALVRGNIELPSDFDGVVYISLDKEDWKTKLGAEVNYLPSDGIWKKDAVSPRRYLAIRIRPRQGELLRDGNRLRHFCIVTNRSDPEGGHCQVGRF
jgi:predicted nucleotide-binding protein